MKDADRYKPIDCGMHDRLLERATGRRPTRIAYRDEPGQVHEVFDIIVDVYTRSGAEYLRLAQEQVIRLDKIIQFGD